MYLTQNVIYSPKQSNATRELFSDHSFKRLLNFDPWALLASKYGRLIGIAPEGSRNLDFNSPLSLEGVPSLRNGDHRIMLPMEKEISRLELFLPAYASRVVSDDKCFMVNDFCNLVWCHASCRWMSSGFTQNGTNKTFWYRGFCEAAFFYIVRIEEPYLFVNELWSTRLSHVYVAATAACSLARRRRRRWSPERKKRKSSKTAAATQLRKVLHVAAAAASCSLYFHLKS